MAFGKTKEADRPQELEPAAKQELEPVAPAGLNAYIGEMEEAAGAGFEDVKSSDLAMPLFKLLQSGTPEAKREDATYVRGARAGLYLDTITQRMFTQLTFVPCKFVTHYIEWDATKLGVMIKNHGTDRTEFDKCIRDEKTGRDMTARNTTIVPTMTWFGLVIGGKEIDPSRVDDEGTEVELLKQAVISFYGTASTPAKRWLSDSNSLQLPRAAGGYFKPPMFAMTYTMASQGTKNDKGSWFLPTFTRAGFVFGYPNGKTLFAEAKELARQANEIHMQVNHARNAPVDESAATSSRSYGRDNNPQAPIDDDIPF